MSGSPAPEIWLEPFLVLAVGTTLVAGVATVAGRVVGAAENLRAVWQIAILSLLLLLVGESTGSGRALLEGGRALLSSGGPRAGVVTAGDLEPTAPTVPLRLPGGTPTPELLGRVVALREAPLPISVPVHDVAANDPVSLRSRPAASTTAAPLTRWWPAILWTLGATSVALRLVLSWLALGLLRRRSFPAGDRSLLEDTALLSRRLGLRRSVGVRVSPTLTGPVAFGILRPTVVVPAEFAERHGAAERQAILAHEVAHLAAGDPLWHRLADLATVALWWHPLAWWCRHRLRVASEWAADDASGIVDRGPPLLAACLVAMGRELTRPRSSWLVGVEGSGFRSSLGRRVERLLRPRRRAWRERRRSRWCLLRTGTATFLAGAVLSCTIWARSPDLTKGGFDMNSSSGTRMGRWQECFRRSLAGMALVTLFAGSPGATAQDDPFDLEVDQRERDGKKTDRAKDPPEPEPADAGVADELESPPRDGPAEGDNRDRVIRALQEQIRDLRTQLAELKEDHYRRAFAAQTRAAAAGAARAGPAVEATPPPPAPADPAPVGPASPPPQPPRLATKLRPMATASVAAPAAPLSPSTAMGPHLDLVSLAITFTDAVGNERISLYRVESRQKMVEQNVISRDEFAVSELELEAARRKVRLLRQIAEAALRSTESEVGRLEQQVEIQKTRYRTGKATVMSLAAAENQLGRAKANLEILKAIIASN